MRPKVVIYDFSYFIMSIVLHTRFNVVQLNDSVFSNQIVSFCSNIFRFYILLKSAALHFGTQKAKNQVFGNLYYEIE